MSLLDDRWFPMTGNAHELSFSAKVPYPRRTEPVGSMALNGCSGRFIVLGSVLPRRLADSLCLNGHLPAPRFLSFLVRCLNKFTMVFGNLGWGVRYVGCVRVSLLRKHFQAFSERCHGCLGPAFRAWFGFVVDDVFEIGSLLDREFLQSFPRFGRNLMAVVVY